MSDDYTEEGSGDDGITPPGGTGGDSSNVKYYSVSTTSGNLLYSYIFVNNYLEYLIVPSDLVIADPDIQPDPNFNVWISSQSATEVVSAITMLDAAYCIAYKVTRVVHFDNVSENDPGLLFFDNYKNVVDKEIAPPDEGTGPPDNAGYSVNVSVTPIDAGVVEGGGYIPIIVTVIIIKAIPYTGYKFKNWTGDFSGRTAQFDLEIDGDKNATAVFEKMPCIDFAIGKSSPLINLALAPPNIYNIAGATWGYTRTTKKKEIGHTQEDSLVFHSGIDLKANVGDPVYSMFDGIVDVNLHDKQPNKVAGDYPSNYSGEKNKAGNRIYINSMINGQNIQVGYWHLQAGNPIAINPRTNMCFKAGDLVYPGDIIGYVGVTGNASQNVPHLHLIIKKNDSIINPDQYINGTISASNVKINTPCGH